MTDDKFQHCSFLKILDIDDFFFFQLTKPNQNQSIVRFTLLQRQYYVHHLNNEYIEVNCLDQLKADKRKSKHTLTQSNIVKHSYFENSSSSALRKRRFALFKFWHSENLVFNGLQLTKLYQIIGG